MTRRAPTARQTERTQETSKANHEIPGKKQANENRKSKPATSVSGYSTMVQRTADLWREQLGSLMNAPAAGQDLSKLMEPAHQFFTQGVDFWLVLLEQFSKNAAVTPFSAANSFQDTQHGREKSPRNAKQQEGANRAQAAAGGTSPGAGALAQFTARLGDIERRLAAIEAGGRSAAKPRASAKKKAPEAI